MIDQNKKSFGEKVKDKVGELKETIKKKPLPIALTVIAVVYVSGLISRGLYCLANFSQKPKFDFGPRALIEWCTSIRGLICLIVISVAFGFFYKYQIKSRQREETGVKDDRNFKYSEESPYGTARPNTEKDLDKILEFKPVEETYGTILGQTADGRVVSIPTAKEFAEKAKKNHWDQDDKTNSTRNKNIIISGSPGTMKSRAIIMNEILQSIRCDDSIFVNDPKGELYEKTHNILVEHGYDVKMFNLVNLTRSDSWNPLKELIMENDDGELEIASEYAKIFATTVVNNANENGEQFWNDNSMNLLKACILYPGNNTLGDIYDFITQHTLDELAELFMQLPSNSVSRRAFNIFWQSSEPVKGQIINGLGITLDIFQDDKIRNITGEHEIDLTKPAKEKCAYFVITSDQHRVYDYLGTLFWTMTFIKLVNYIDANRDENGDPTTKPIRILLDEYPNSGEIFDFNRKLSTVRSRLIGCTIIMQNLSQLMNRHPNGEYEEIFSDCDFAVFLGCNDVTTANFYSEMTGIASIEVKTQNSTYARDKAFLNQSVDYKEVKSIGQRTVMNADEVRSIPNTDMLLFIRGTKSVYQCKKFDYSKHPMTKELTMYKIKDHVPQWKTKLNKAKEEEKQRKAEAKKKLQEENERKQQIIADAKKRDEERQKQEQENTEAFLSNFSQTAIPISGNENTLTDTKPEQEEKMQLDEFEAQIITPKEKVKPKTKPKKQMFNSKAFSQRVSNDIEKELETETENKMDNELQLQDLFEGLNSALKSGTSDGKEK